MCSSLQSAPPPQVCRTLKLTVNDKASKKELVRMRRVRPDLQAANVQALQSCVSVSTMVDVLELVLAKLTCEQWAA